MLANTETFDARRLARELARVLLPGVGPIGLPLTAAERAVYAGEYVLGSHLPVRVWDEGGRLRAQAQGQDAFGLLYRGDNVFAAEFDPDVTLTFAVTGARASGFTLREGLRVTEARRAR